jgi:A/G-specific adenine glycosylase
MVTSGPSRDPSNRDVLAWFGTRRRAFPWRGRPANPYRVWVSEVMLQQTQASRVAPAFEAFIERFPSVADLAAALTADVVRAWSGLGYNRRAVALSLAARKICSTHGGMVPAEPRSLQQLPGVGPYTAAAIASIAFGAPVPAIDTNVGRVVARARLGAEPHEVPARSIADAALSWIDRGRPGDWNQALMDLGRDVCRRRPTCQACPLSSACVYARGHRVATPRPAPPSPFEGSDRQVRGSIVRVLRGEAGWISLARLAAATGHSIDRVAVCLGGLRSDGLLSAGPAALAARPTGRVRLVSG